MKELKIKMLKEGAHAPERGNSGDLGYDLFSAERIEIPKGAMRLVKTGIAVQFPEGWGGIIKDRSSMAMKRLTTSAGVIDEGYRGEIGVLISNHSDADVTIDAGGKIAQMVPVQVTDWNVSVVENLDDTERGEGGYGSTGSHKQTPLSPHPTLKE